MKWKGRRKSKNIEDRRGELLNTTRIYPIYYQKPFIVLNKKLHKSMMMRLSVNNKDLKK